MNPCGRLVVTTSQVVGPRSAPVREEIIQELYLHPTKGWRRGPRTKKLLALKRFNWQNRAIRITKTWNRW